MAYLEIKTHKYIDATLAQQIIDKKTVIGLLTTGKISMSAKSSLIKLVLLGQKIFQKNSLWMWIEWRRDNARY